MLSQPRLIHRWGISIHLMLILIVLRRQSYCTIYNFNTSHVNVNRVQATIKYISFHISIHLMLMLIPYKMFGENVLEDDFNTSHVNVNLNKIRCKLRCIVISIHLMLMLIMNIIWMKFQQHYFNTSHVNVNHHLSLL